MWTFSFGQFLIINYLAMWSKSYFHPSIGAWRPSDGKMVHNYYDKKNYITYSFIPLKCLALYYYEPKLGKYHSLASPHVVLIILSVQFFLGFSIFFSFSQKFYVLEHFWIINTMFGVAGPWYLPNFGSQWCTWEG